MANLSGKQIVDKPLKFVGKEVDNKRGHVYQYTYQGLEIELVRDKIWDELWIDIWNPTKEIGESDNFSGAEKNLLKTRNRIDELIAKSL